MGFLGVAEHVDISRGALEKPTNDDITGPSRDVRTIQDVETQPSTLVTGNMSLATKAVPRA
jgi:hypothetical protein